MVKILANKARYGKNNDHAPPFLHDVDHAVSARPGIERWRVPQLEVTTANVAVKARADRIDNGDADAVVPVSVPGGTFDASVCIRIRLAFSIDIAVSVDNCWTTAQEEDLRDDDRDQGGEASKGRLLDVIDLPFGPRIVPLESLSRLHQRTFGPS